MVKPRDEFVSLMKDSMKAAAIVAASLREDGFEVEILPSKGISPNEARRWSYVDHGDLVVSWGIDKERIEAKKWPNIDFFTLDEIPYADIIVDESYKIEKPGRLPLFAYIIVNSSETAYLSIPIWTKGHWFIDTKLDRREGTERAFYFCPKQYVTINELKRAR